ncbi:MAG: Fe(2+)-trafficking protein, partial [OM182 bacterium]|nr:Fe(2+)-trafficking protein [OM182 bacterium]
MSRTVFCRKFQQDLPGLMAPPYPGDKGQELFMNVSQKAWSEWQSHQT